MAPLYLESYISRKGAKLGCILLLNINRKSCIGNPVALPDLTMDDLERSQQGYLHIEW